MIKKSLLLLTAAASLTIAARLFAQAPEKTGGFTECEEYARKATDAVSIQDTDSETLEGIQKKRKDY